MSRMTTVAEKCPLPLPDAPAAWPSAGDVTVGVAAAPDAGAPAAVVESAGAVEACAPLWW